MLTIAPNVTGRDFIVGALEGRGKEFCDTLCRQDFDPSVDRLFCTGNLIAADEGSLGLLRLFLQSNWFYLVRGQAENEVAREFALPELVDRLIRSRYPWMEQLTAHEQFRIAQALHHVPYAIEIPGARGPIGIIHGSLPRWATWKAVASASMDVFSGSYEKALAHAIVESPYVNAPHARDPQLRLLVTGMGHNDAQMAARGIVSIDPKNIGRAETMIRMFELDLGSLRPLTVARSAMVRRSIRMLGQAEAFAIPSNLQPRWDRTMSRDSW